MTEDKLRKQAWDFLQMQASQRLTTFNFFIAISTVMCTGLAASFRTDTNIPHLGEILGFFLVVFSFVFFKLDERNRDLIKSAEEALKYFESKVNIDVETSGVPHVAKRFTREEYDTKAKKNQRSWLFWRNHYSYSDCFRIVFLSFGGAGLVGAAYSLLRQLA